MCFVLIHNLAKVSKTLFPMQNKLLNLCNYTYMTQMDTHIRLLFRILILMVTVSAAAGCSIDDRQEDPGESEGTGIGRTFFAKGADISWATQMEADGVKFYNASGEQEECTAVMKEAGADAVRLRVWVEPEEGWCGKEDVLTKALRAQKLGMKIMIDFHYSDTWADPGNQKVPAAWGGYGVTDLAEAVGQHTREVLNTLKDNGVNVEWVQVGNEVNSGMLHPLGNIGNAGNIANFAAFFNAGSKAVREVYAGAKVILHRSEGHDTDGFAWILNVAEAQDMDYDLIGMSLYPSWWENGGFTSWEPAARQCMANIRTFAERFGKGVMICEFGMPASEPEMSRAALRYLLDQAKEVRQLHGVFYWEPQVYGGWKPAGYEALGWSAYDKGAFKDGRPTSALDPFKQTIQ